MTMTTGGVDLLATTKANSTLALAHTAALLATAKASASTDTAADTGNAITSNDFLTLLVTEMKNQDPTQPTDPNAYIQQLVEVNSLQQLIAIHGVLAGSDPTAQTNSSGSAAQAATAAPTSI